MSARRVKAIWSPRGDQLGNWSLLPCVRTLAFPLSRSEISRSLRDPGTSARSNTICRSSGDQSGVKGKRARVTCRTAQVRASITKIPFSTVLKARRLLRGAQLTSIDSVGAILAGHSAGSAADGRS